jgi:hypothetical protein
LAHLYTSNPSRPAADTTGDPYGGCGGGPTECTASGNPAAHLRRDCIWPPISTTGRVSVRAEGQSGPLYQGPYKVLGRKEKFFKLEIGGQPEVIIVDRLKPYLGTAPVTAASLPQCGRPKGPGAVAASFPSSTTTTGGPLWRIESGSSGDRNPGPIIDNYINVLPDFLCQLFSDAH